MSVDHGGFDILVPLQFLHGAEFITRFVQVRGKAVAERVRADRVECLVLCGSRDIGLLGQVRKKSFNLR
jgi:hypothetical protein